MNNSNLPSIFEKEITQQGLSDLEVKYPKNLVMDMSDDENLKAGRKIRTERNKLVEAINRRRIDTTADIKKMGDDLVESVNNIYSVVIDPFEKEDKRRKDEAAKLAAEKKQIIDADMRKIEALKGFIGQARISSSDQISGMIDAVENTDCTIFHKDLIHEAIEAKEFALVSLGEALTSKLENEQTQKENEALKARLAKLEEKEIKEDKPETINDEWPIKEHSGKNETEGEIQAVFTINVSLNANSIDSIHKQLVDVLGNNEEILYYDLSRSYGLPKQSSAA